MAKKITLKRVRLGAYPDLYAARQYNNTGDFSYGARFVIEPGSDAFNVMSQAYQEVATEAWKATTSTMLESFKGNTLKTCFANGTAYPTVPAYNGKFVVGAKKKQKDGPVEVRDRDGKTLITEREAHRVYGGCVVNAIVEVWAQTKSTPGMRCKLLGVQFVEDADAFVAGSAAEDTDFELSDGDDAPDVGGAAVGGFV